MSKTTNRLAPKVRGRMVRMVADREHDYPFCWGAVASIAEKIGCVLQALLKSVTKADIGSGTRAGVPAGVADKVKALERGAVGGSPAGAVSNDC